MKIAIIGGGISELTTTIGFQQLGIFCTVYEAAPHIQATALSGNPIKVPQNIGIASCSPITKQLLPLSKHTTI